MRSLILLSFSVLLAVATCTPVIRLGAENNLHGTSDSAENVPKRIARLWHELPVPPRSHPYYQVRPWTWYPASAARTSKFRQASSLTQDVLSGERIAFEDTKVEPQSCNRLSCATCRSSGRCHYAEIICAGCSKDDIRRIDISNEEVNPAQDSDSEGSEGKHHSGSKIIQGKPVTPKPTDWPFKGFESTACSLEPGRTVPCDLDEEVEDQGELKITVYEFGA